MRWSKGKFLRHAPCPNCGSSDALSIYDNGTSHCFSCDWNDQGDGTTIDNQPQEKRDWTPLEVEIKPLPKRGLFQETCEAWGYGTSTYKGEGCQVAVFRDERGKLIAQKLRLPGKKFLVLGEGKNLPLWGIHKFSGGKHLVITEGEIDALSVSQVFDNKWPVVSLPNGAQSVEKAIPLCYEWLDKFERIVLMFDMDGPGQEAAEKAAALLPPGKAAIATLPHKDANETLLSDGPSPIIRAFWNAPLWRPDGIKHIADVEQDFLHPPEVRGIPYPWSEFNDVLGMMRLGALVTLTAGTGIGKSTLMRELIHWTAVEHKEPVGVLMLEEDNVETIEGIVGIGLSKNILADRGKATPEETRAEYEKLKALPIYVYDHFGSSDIDNICQRIRYLVKVCGVRWIFLDHISILVSGLEGDERRIIDIAMTKLRTLVSELKIGMFCIVHLRRPQGDKGHEDGAEVHLGQLRGSHSVAQLSDAVIALNKDDKDPHGFNVYPVCMKNRRNAGKKGPMGRLTYDPESGRLSECQFQGEL